MVHGMAAAAVAAVALLGAGPTTTSYMPVDQKEPFAAVMARMKAARAVVENKHQDLLLERYDLTDHPAKGAAMSRGKPVQEDVRALLAKGVTWDALAAMAPEE